MNIGLMAIDSAAGTLVATDVNFEWRYAFAIYVYEEILKFKNINIRNYQLIFFYFLI